jgi:hypothetical protein
MKKFIFIIIFSCIECSCFAQEEKEKCSFGLTASGVYTYSGLGVIVDAEFKKGNNILYTGPKFPISRTYLPFKGTWGWNLGYRHNLSRSPEKRLVSHLNIDYQIAGAKAFSQTESTNRRNYIHELFIGYGLQYRLCRNLFIGNTIGIGLYRESFYNVDLDWKQTYTGYNNLLKIFLNYTFQ